MIYRKSAAYQLTEITAFAHRRKMLWLLCLAATCMVLTISGCDFRKVDAQTENNLKEVSKMESLQSSQHLQSKIPPIDSTVSTETETATFAMG
jgi:hypothetical protein